MIFLWCWFAVPLFAVCLFACALVCAFYVTNKFLVLTFLSLFHYFQSIVCFFYCFICPTQLSSTREGKGRIRKPRTLFVRPRNFWNCMEPEQTTQKALECYQICGISKSWHNRQNSYYFARTKSSSLHPSRYNAFCYDFCLWPFTFIISLKLFLPLRKLVIRMERRIG